MTGSVTRALRLGHFDHAGVLGVVGEAAYAHEPNQLEQLEGRVAAAQHHLWS